MLIFVKFLTGKTVQIVHEALKPTTLIKDLKQIIYERERNGNLPAQQRLVFNSQQLEDDRTLASYKIQSESTIHVLMPVFDKCIVCKAVFNDDTCVARVLWCGHKVCEADIAKAGAGASFSCPEVGCGKSYTKLAFQGSLLDGLLEDANLAYTQRTKQGEATVAMCELCDEQHAAVFYCVNDEQVRWFKL